MNCKLYQRETKENDFCELHQKAYDNLMESYTIWTKALKTSWKEYLSQIAENSSAGDCAKEVAKYLTENGET